MQHNTDAPFAIVYGSPDIQRLHEYTTDSIITLEIQGLPVFCRIVKNNKDCLRVTQLHTSVSLGNILFHHTHNYIHPVTKNNIRKTRKIYTLVNAVTL